MINFARRSLLGFKFRQRDVVVRTLKRRFYDDHYCKVDGSTPTQVSLLRPWITTTTSLFLASGKNRAQNGAINTGSREVANRPFGHQVKQLS